MADNSYTVVVSDRSGWVDPRKLFGSVYLDYNMHYFDRCVISRLVCIAADAWAWITHPRLTCWSEWSELYKILGQLIYSELSGERTRDWSARIKEVTDIVYKTMASIIRYMMCFHHLAVLVCFRLVFFLWTKHVKCSNDFNHYTLFHYYN